MTLGDFALVANQVRDMRKKLGKNSKSANSKSGIFHATPKRAEKTGDGKYRNA